MAMAGIGGLFHRFATLALVVSTLVQVTEAIASGESLKVADTARLRGLRAQSHSSHGLRANVFRAASTARTRMHSRLVQAPGAVPLYVPKMGLANVTDPTPFPPPPPVLHPWSDHQPLDTAIGNYLISGFIAQPTVTPPPTQASLDLAFACPALLTWPGEIAVSAPDPCGEMDNGNWTTKSGDVQIKWSTSCIDTTSPGITMPSISPVTTYSVGNGDLFGSSQERASLSGSVIEIRDCGGAAVFTVEEKVYKQAGAADPEICAKYHSCDGVIYFQYFMKDMGGNTVALSPYTTIFQEAFDITDTAGGKIATVSRNGWEPDDLKPECSANSKPRVWNIKYASSPPGNWAAATNQWPLATFMTMLAHRDQYRQPDGRVVWSPCETVKATGWALSGGALFCCLGCTPMVIFLLCSAPILRFVTQAEERLFPRRMGKPAIYGN